MANAAKVRCRVARVQPKGQGTYILELEPLSRVPRFRAGQFLHLTVDEFDPQGGFWPESRVFSIASRAGSERLILVYSVKGRYTKIMEKRLAPGLEIWVKLPFGDFHIESRVASGADLVLVAGGTGISPFIPYLGELSELGAPTRKTRLFYGMRSPDQLLFGELLSLCAAKGLLDLRIWLESGDTAGGGVPALPAVETGRLDPVRVLGECQDLHEQVFFLSGPPAMIQSFKSCLLNEGIPQSRIQIDEWE